MPVRKYNKPQDDVKVQPFTWEQQRQWLTNEQCAIYARQSTTKQTVENRESSEAQTQDQLAKVRATGWTDDKITVFIEGDGKRGVSGRLRIDERTGLNALMEGIYNNTFKYVFVMNEARLFRDEWMIGPDTFIKACYEHDVVVVTWTYRYDFRRNPYDMDQFRLQSQIAARFVKDHVGYMNRMRDRVAERGQYFGGCVTMGYIIDRREELEERKPNPNFCRYIPYQPHAKIVRWLFKRYRELDGNIQQLGRELHAKGYAFPLFEQGIEVPFTRLKKVDGGYCLSSTGIALLLTNVHYVGYWTFHKRIRRDKDGQPIINHEPIVDGEDFWYAFNRLSPTTINGEINDQRPRTIIRYDREGVPLSTALLKNVITSVNANVYVSKVRQPNGWREKYTIRLIDSEFDTVTKAARIDISLLDAAFLNKMFEHLEAWKEHNEENAEVDNIGQAIHQHMQEEKDREQKNPVQIIEEQLEQLVPKIAHYDRLIDKGYNLPEEKINEYAQKLTGLLKQQKELESVKKSIEKEVTEREESQGLVDEALAQWNDYSIEQKRRVIRAVVDSTIISRVTPTWLKVEILWKGIGTMLPTTDTGYFWLPGASNQDWTPEEQAILREMYPNEHADTILERLPLRAWQSIRHQAYMLKIKRNVFKSPSEKTAYYLSVNDHKFMEQHHINLAEKERGYMFWSDNEAFLPISSEDQISDTDDLLTSDNLEGTSRSRPGRSR